MLKFAIAGGALELDPIAVVIAGFAGRDRAAVDAHIAELAAEGVPAPSTVPSFWMASPELLVQGGRLCVTHARTSGEAEVALVVTPGQTWVTLASDHTDRAAEALDFGLSKQVCSKPIATEAWRIEEVRDEWDRMRLRSWVKDADGAELRYQDEAAAAVLPPEDLLERLVPPPHVECFVLLCGTVPTLGALRMGTAFRAELARSDGRSMALTYRVDVVPTIAAPAGDGAAPAPLATT